MATSGGDDERPTLEYARLDRELKRPRDAAPWWMYVRDVLAGVLLTSAFCAAVVYVAKWLGV